MAKFSTLQFLLVLCPSLVWAQTCEPGYKYAVSGSCSKYKTCLVDESGASWQIYDCPAATVFCESDQDCTNQPSCSCDIVTDEPPFTTESPTESPLTSEPTEPVITTPETTEPPVTSEVSVPVTTGPTTVETEAPCIPEGGDIFQEFIQTQYGNSWYTFVWNPMLSWDDAVNACERNCSVLTSIETIEEREFLAQFIATQPRAWIGGTDVARPQYEWIDTSERIPDILWALGQPDGVGEGIENCVELWSPTYPFPEVGINDWQCSIASAFICKLQ